ncbi:MULTISPECIES: hypothetical protein [Listeria]|uniref:hypothetical protein n=1 Tax=Listeria TaxID=1637 RepID=UPI000B589BBB|nr:MULTISPECIES: hypothetical protein [Listeria]
MVALTESIAPIMEEQRKMMQRHLQMNMDGAKEKQLFISEEEILALIQAHYDRLEEQIQENHFQKEEEVRDAFGVSLTQFFREMAYYFGQCVQKIGAIAEEKYEAIAQRLHHQLDRQAEQKTSEFVTRTEKKMQPKTTEDTPEEKSVKAQPREQSLPVQNGNKTDDVRSIKKEKKAETPVLSNTSSMPKQTEKEPAVVKNPPEQKREEESQKEAPNVKGQTEKSEDPYMNSLMDTLIPDNEEAPTMTKEQVEEIQEDTRSTFKDVADVVEHEADKNGKVLAVAELEAILKEREERLVTMITTLLEDKSAASLPESLKAERQSTIQKVKTKYQSTKQSVKEHTTEKVVELKTKLVQGLQRTALRLNQKLYNFAVHMDEKLQPKQPTLLLPEAKTPLLEAYPAMKEAGFTLTVQDEPYLIRYSQETNEVVMQQQQEEVHRIDYSDDLSLEEVEQTLDQKLHTDDKDQEKTVEV